MRRAVLRTSATQTQWRDVWISLRSPCRPRLNFTARELSFSAPTPQPRPNCQSTVSTTLPPSSAHSTSTRVHATAQPIPAPTTAQRCDPYEQRGQPLTTEDVTKLLPTLDAGWRYDPTTRALSRTFSFRPPPSALSPPSSALSPLFAFVTRVGHVCINDGHPPHSLSLSPRRLSVDVVLRTPALHGLSYRDLALALTLDGLSRSLRAQSTVAGSGAKG